MEKREMRPEEDKEIPAPRPKKQCVSSVPPVCSESTKSTFDPSDVGKWLASLQSDGFVILRGVIDEGALEEARHGLTMLVDDLAERLVGKGLRESVLANEPFDTRLLKLYEGCPNELPNLFRKELHRQEFFRLLCHPELLKIVRLVLHSAKELRIFPNYSARPKTLHNIHDVTWHQDAGLRGDGGPSNAPVGERLDAFGIDSVVNCWTPLVPARSINGAMKFIPKSQLLGILPHTNMGKFLGKDASGNVLQGQVGTYMTGVDPSEMAKLEKSAIDVEMDPGDVVLFSNLLVHRGGQNSGDRIRWSFDWRFQDASKPTCRAEQGHVVWSSSGEVAASTPEEWARLQFC